MKTRLFFLATLLMLLAGQAQAWWNGDWTGRKNITVDASASGVDAKQAQTNAVIAVRLHTGNFIFVDAKEDGSDLRFVSGDDKTPLKFHVEKFDAANELAVVWVQVPGVAAGSKTELWMYYGNKNAAPAGEAKATYDVNQTAVFHFAETDGKFQDQTGYGNQPREASAKAGLAGPMAGAAQFDGNARLVLSASPSLKLAKGAGFTFSAWIKPVDAAGGVLFSQQEGASSIRVAVEGGKLIAAVGGAGGKARSPGAMLTPGAWQHVAVTVADHLNVYVNGQPVGATPAALPDLGGEVVIGSGFKGELDEVQLSNVARSAEAIRVAALDQGPDGRLVVVGEDEAAVGGSQSYLSILLGAVTLDGWVVIGLLGVMAVISWAVMVGKGHLVGKMDRANQSFIEEFRKLSADMVVLDGAGAAKNHPFAHSSIYRVYRIGVQELKHRFEIYAQRGMERNLTPQAIDAIRASLDAGMTREQHRLNAQMVFLTIAISGGPFLGLLGTVVGVMITFAAIAAAGDVNVNAIAPGIAAALVATVAGLAVAIPALFGYNYLTSRIKNISTDLQVFGDEFITKLAENYSA